MPRINYRKLAFDAYAERRCVHCGFGIAEVLEVAHIDGNRSNNDVANLALLCPTCHKMMDVGLIPAATMIEMRDAGRKVNWSRRMKDAGMKAAATRKRRRAARKAVQTRRQNSGS